MTQPLISIITVTYQAETVLVRTIESILGLDYMNLEYIIVDGGSKDNTIQIIKSYIEKFKSKNIVYKWQSETDNGLYDAMNKGLKIATGDYVWFMNAGDRVASDDCLSKINFSSLPDFIYGETIIVDEMGTTLGKRRLKAPENLNWTSFRMGMLVCHQSMIVKRNIAKEFDLHYKFSSDFDWSIKCLKAAKIIYNSNTILSHFLDGGVSKKKMQDSLKERFEIMAKYYGFLNTAFRHVWFAIRAFSFKLKHGWF